MRTKRTMMLLATLSMIVLALMLCSCSLFSSKDDNTTPTPDTSETEKGWTEREVADSTIYSKLLQGCADVAFQGSQTSINSNSGIFTLDTKLKISVNDTSLWLILKAKYNGDSPRDNSLASLELSTTETPSDSSRIMTAYFYKDSVYITLGSDSNIPAGKSNKAKVALNNIGWVDYFPYKMDRLTSDNKKFQQIVGMLGAGIKKNGDVPNKAEYRRGMSGDEWRYTIDIDLDETITRLFQELAKYNDLDFVPVIKKFIAAFYGVQESSITNGDLSRDYPSRVVVKYNTLNTMITSVDVSFDIGTAQSALFPNKKMQGNASIERLSIGNNFADLKVSLPEESKLNSDYTDFTNTVFSLTLHLDEYVGGSLTPNRSTLQITTKIFQGMGSEDFVFAEYTNNNQLKHGLYVYNNICYIFSIPEGSNDYSCLCSFDIGDLGDVATNIATNNLGSNSVLDPTKLIAYVLKCVSMDASKIRFSIKQAFYKDVWYNFDDICNYIDSFTADSLTEIQGVKDIYDYIRMNEVVITFDLNTPFLTIVGSNDSSVQAIVSRLNTVDESTRLSSAGSEPAPEVE